MSTHLFRRQGGTYYFRRAIPVNLRHLFDGRREWIASLRTKDRVEAKRLLPAMVQAFDTAMAVDQLVVPPPRGPLERNEQLGRLSVAEQPGKASVPLIATFQAYAVEQGLKPGTAAEWRSMLKALIAFVGHDDAARLTVSDIDRWRDYLLTQPGRGGKLRSPGTVKDKYLCALRATLSWAVEKRKLPENVATSVKVRTPSRLKLRERDFTVAEGNAVLEATLVDHRECSDYDKRARRWIPWLCAYTGARVNELSQLRGNDVINQNGIWCLRISPEAGTVKNNSVRLIPLHSHVIEQGFLSLAVSHGNDPVFYDTSRIKTAGPANRYFKKVGERLRDWVRNEVGITDSAVQPNHAWRHTFKTRCIDAGIPERIADAIQGHAPRSVGQSYGSVSLEAKAKAIASLPRFEIASPG